MKKAIILIFVFLISLPIAFSLNVTLQQANSENLADVSAYNAGGAGSDVNRGTDTTCNFRDHTTDIMRCYFMFNLSIIPSGSTINEAYLGVYQNYREAAITARVHEVNSTLNELNLTHNNQNCGHSFNNDTMCNLTQESSITVDPVAFYVWNVTRMVRRAMAESRKNVSMVIKSPETGSTPGNTFAMKEFATVSQRPFLNVTYTSVTPDTTPPTITNYSNQGSSCTSWNTNPSNACTTSDTTPTLYFNTSEAAFCIIGTTNSNYTAMGSLRNCTVGENTIEHVCHLIPEDELVYEDSIVYLSCKDASGNMNTTSTSGPLSLTVTGLETSGDTSIGTGIQNALLSGYTNYTEVQIYARNLSNSQVRGTFDRMAKRGSKVWAFNYVTKGQQHVNIFNLTPVLYVIEMSNITGTNITKTVEAMINATK